MYSGPDAAHSVRGRVSLGLLAAALGVAACGGSESAVDGPVMRYPTSGGGGDQMGAEIRGVVQIDGDWLYLSFDEVGERSPILWPAGTTWDVEAQAVVLPNGETVSHGDEVEGGGGYLDVGAVERLAGGTAADLARECVDNTYGEIAVVNNVDDAIGGA